MGYTHYFSLKNELKESVLGDVREVLSKYADILSYEFDSKDDPIITIEQIRFNGYDDAGYETFFVESGGSSFCKTNMKEYDLPVCEVLLVLKYHYRDDFELSSDGFYVSKDQMSVGEIEGNWVEALYNVSSELGYKYDLIGIEDGGYYKYNISVGEGKICQAKSIT